MNIQIYNHKSNDDNTNNLKITPILNDLKGTSIKINKGCSKKIREIITDIIIKQGWSSKVKLSIRSQISITAMNGSYALCLQTGNVSRIYADLLKIQYLFQRGTIAEAVYIVPTKRNAKIMGSNVANFERMVKELKLFDDVITVPITIIGLD